MRHGPGDLAATKLASEQHSLLRVDQLLYLGLSRDAVSHRVRAGHLRRMHRGVYLSGPGPITDLQRVGAAILACGPDAIVSHRAAAYLWGLLALDPAMVDILMLDRRRRPRPNIRFHVAGSLDRRDLRRRELLPLTSPPLTILAVAESETSQDLESAINEARKRKIVRREELIRLRERTPNRRGWAALQPFLDQGNDDYSRSRAENDLMTLISAAGLPAPRRNVRVHGHELDFYWPQLSLNVEVDGVTWHSAREHVNRDHERDTELASHGVWVVRFTRDQIRFGSERVVARLAAAVVIAQGRARGGARLG